MLNLSRVFSTSALTDKEYRKARTAPNWKEESGEEKRSMEQGHRHKWRQTDRKDLRTKKYRAGKRQPGLYSHSKGERWNMDLVRRGD